MCGVVRWSGGGWVMMCCVVLYRVGFIHVHINFLLLSSFLNSFHYYNHNIPLHFIHYYYYYSLCGVDSHGLQYKLTISTV